MSGYHTGDLWFSSLEDIPEFCMFFYCFVLWCKNMENKNFEYIYFLLLCLIFSTMENTITSLKHKCSQYDYLVGLSAAYCSLKWPAPLLLFIKVAIGKINDSVAVGVKRLARTDLLKQKRKNRNGPPQARLTHWPLGNLNEILDM